MAAAELFSYVAVWVWSARPTVGGSISTHKGLHLLAGAGVSVLIAHCVSSAALWKGLALLTPNILVQAFAYLFPIRELAQAWQILNDLSLEPDILHHMAAHLLFVTFHIQVGIGYLGIQFLHKQQERKNQLIRLDIPVACDTDDDDVAANGTNGSNSKDSKQQLMAERSRKFKRGAAPFST